MTRGKEAACVTCLLYAESCRFLFQIFKSPQKSFLRLSTNSAKERFVANFASPFFPGNCSLLRRIVSRTVERRSWCTHADVPSVTGGCIHSGKKKKTGRRCVLADVTLQYFFYSSGCKWLLARSWLAERKSGTAKKIDKRNDGLPLGRKCPYFLTTIRSSYGLSQTTPVTSGEKKVNTFDVAYIFRDAVHGIVNKKC